MSEPKIQTSPIFPPIPIRGLDWCAHFDNYEPGQPIGHGATEQEAIEDLKSLIEYVEPQHDVEGTSANFDRYIAGDR